MADQGITPEQLDAVLQQEYEALKQRICDAMNAAQAGRIIADTEEPVRDAHAAFRQQAYAKAISLLAEQCGPEAFPPSGRPRRSAMEE
ncbi:MAG: hypothetical protein ACLFVN_13535 [Phycisphaeraceae bacterium]